MSILRTAHRAAFSVFLAAAGYLGFNYYMTFHHGKKEIAENYRAWTEAIKSPGDPRVWLPLEGGPIRTYDFPNSPASQNFDLDNFRQAAAETMAVVMITRKYSREVLGSIRPLAERTVNLDVSGNTVFDLARSWHDAKVPKMPVMSTFLTDNRAFPERGKFAGNNDRNSSAAAVDLSDSYCQALNLSCGPLPENIRGLRFTTSPLLGLTPQAAASRFGDLPPLFNMVFHKGERSLPLLFYPLVENGSWSRQTVTCTDKHAAPYWLVQNFRKEIRWAAEQIARAHREANPVNVELALLASLFGSTSAEASEDGWQDKCGLLAAHDPAAETFSKLFSNQPIGPILGGRPRNLPCFAWQMASSWYKWHLTTQSFGPYSVHMRYSQLAAQDRNRLKRFSPYLSEHDFATDAATISALASPRNPVKGIMAKAMIFDYVYSLLEETVYKDDRLRLPANAGPFIMNESGARQYALICSALWGVGYPEGLPSANDFPFTILSNGCYPLLYANAAIFGVKPDFPGLIDIAVSLPGGEVYRPSLQVLW